jgi:hypothetical protein
MNFKIRATILSFALSFFVQLCHAQNFAPAVSYGTGQLPDGSAAADFNNDGNVDVVVANAGSGTLSLFLGNGDGTLTAAGTIPLGIPNPLTIATGDFNGDGNVDVAVAGVSSSPVIQILFGNGNGTFSPPISVTIPGLPQPGVTGLFVFPEIAVSDLNSDKKPDIAVATSSGVAVLLNDGSGNFTVAGSVASGQVIQNVALADVNNDGISDVVFMTTASGGPNTFLSIGNGDGTFRPPVTLPLTTQLPDGIAIADFNNDGLLDVAVDDNGGSGSQNGTIQIALQQRGGGFQQAGTLTLSNPTGIVATDFDGDGHIDIGATSTVNGQDFLQVFRGRGDGSFFAANQFPVSAGVLHPIVAHLTNTVAFDAITSGISANQISVLVNHGANTLTLTSSLNPSAITQPVTLRASIQPKFPGSGTFSGSFIFADGSKTLGTATVDPAGAGSFTTTFASTGQHSLLAVFGGNSSFVGGSSASLVQNVNKAQPAVSLSSTVNPSSFGQSVSFNITVSGPGGAAAPTGTVNLLDGSTIILSGTLDSTGKLTLSTSALTAGNHSLTAQYGGDGNYSSASSPIVSQSVGKGTSATQLTGSPNPGSFGQGVSFTAAVTAAPGSSVVPTGTVTFSDGNTTLGSSPLDATGKATLSATSLAAGSHNVTASYSGDTNFSGSSATFSETINKGSSATTLAASPNPNTFGQTITFTTAVTAQTGTAIPTGTVTLLDGATSLGTATLDSQGRAIFNISSLSVGTHTIVASYTGDSNFANSASSPVSQVVNKTTSATTLTASPNPSVFGQAVTLAATVTQSSGGSGIPTGSVSFSDGSTVLGTSQLDNTGKASLAISSLTAGTHPITVAYAGDANFQPSASSIVTQTVTKSATAASVVITPTPSNFGQTISLTASVSASGGAGIPTGSVTFTDGSATLGNATLDTSGKATLAISTLAAGAHSIVVSYAGDSNFQGSVSPSVTQTVNKSGSTTNLTSSPNPSSFGQSITFTVTVNSAAGGGTPSGTVNFTDGAVTLGSAVLDKSGTATFSTGSLSVGSHSIIANYGGDGNFLSSSSAATTQIVSKSASATVVASSQTSSTFGQALTFTAAVSPSGSGNGIPSGSINFTDGVTLLGTATLDNTGKSTFTTSTLSVGTHNVAAVYAGDSNFSSSSSTPLQQIVSKGNTSTSLTASPNPSVFGQAVVLSVTVSAAGGAGVPSGTVSFIDGSTALGTATLDNNGKATLSVTSLAVGSHNITASYTGNGSFNGSSVAAGGAVNQVVSQSSTIATISSSANPSVFGQVVVFTAVVSASGGGGGVPSGAITFMDGTSVLGKATLDSTGTATLTISALSVGSHSISANYAGGTNHLSSTSSALNQSVGKDSVSVALSSVPNPSTFGQAVTFTVQVLPSASGGVPGTTTPTGTITFNDGGLVLGTATLDSSGSATFTVSTLTPGSHTITAVYGGDANFSRGSSNLQTQVVNKTPTQAKLTSSMNPTLNTSTLTLTVSVNASGSPSGNVSFFDGALQLGSASLDHAGTASLVLANLSLGNHIFSAIYSGDNDFATSQTPTVTETVVDSHSSVSISSSANPQLVTKPVTFVATVRSPLGSPVSGGTVMFVAGQNILATIPVVNSMASFTTQSLPVGDDQIVAIYQATSSPSPSDGTASLVETVNEATPVVLIGGDQQDFGISINPIQAQITRGDILTAEVTLIPLHGLTGPVTTLCTGIPQGATCSITPDTATFDGKTPISAKLVITTTGSTTTPGRSTLEPHSPHRPELAVLGYLSLAFGCFFVPGITKRGSGLFALFLVAVTLTGCGDAMFRNKPPDSSTPPGSYTINVQAASGALAHSAQIQLTIQ